MHAAVELADELNAAALLVPTSRGGSPRACAKYPSRRPIIALPDSQTVANQLALEWGVYPQMMDVTGTVDDLVDRALMTAKEFAGLATGGSSCDHRWPTDGNHRSDEPDHGSRDPLSARAGATNTATGAGTVVVPDDRVGSRTPRGFPLVADWAVSARLTWVWFG